MDPFSALSVAAAVVQFLDFGCQVVSKAKAINRSVDGISIDHAQSEAAAKRLAKLAEGMRSSLQLESTACSSSGNGFVLVSRHTLPEDEAIKILCTSCVDLSQELIAKFDRLRVSTGAKHRRWKSLRQALKSVWSKRAIDDISDQLNKHRKELEGHVLLSLSTKLRDFKLSQDERFVKLDEKTQESIQNLAATLQGVHVKLDQVLLRSSAEQQQLMQIDNDSLAKSKELDRRVDSLLLGSLRFSSMDYRKEDICETFQNTYKWALEPPKPDSPQRWSCLVQWLQTGSGIYWMNGKAGSGKSTLMRYVYESSITRTLLSSWADGGELQLATFFCWYSGSAEQRSKAGMLRSLLYEILRQHRELIRKVFEDEWEEYRSLFHSVNDSGHVNMTMSWHVRRLERAFIQLAKSANEQLRLCIFIDGLDECEGGFQHEDHESISQLFKNVASSPYVKICLSSRPWLVFEQAFIGLPSLRLQDLTSDDIRLFVFEKLNSSEKMQSLIVTEPKLSEELVTEITTKSAGVFLWVDLVVGSLLRGLQNDDDLNQLLHRLRELPSTLKKLFQHMLDRIDPTYLPEACRILLIYQSFSEHASRVTPLDLDIAITATYQEALETNRTPMQPEEMIFRRNRITKKLKTHCLGLLEVHDNSEEEDKEDKMYRRISERHENQQDTKSTGANWQSDRIRLDTECRVTYLHRSVAEFLRRVQVKEKLYSEAQKQIGFQSSLSVLMGYLIAIRKSACTHYLETTSTERVWSTIRDALCCSANIPPEFDLRRAIILGELSSSSFRWLGRITESRPESQKLNTGTTLTWESEFLANATVLGLTSYVKNRIDSIGELITGPSQRPLLLHAIGIPEIGGERLMSQWFVARDKWNMSPETVKLLLERGSSPNDIVRWLPGKFEGSTIWDLTLHRLYTQIGTIDLQQPEVSHAWALVIKFFIEHNADLGKPRRLCERSRTLGKEYTIPLVVDAVFKYAAPSDAAMLHRVIEERRTSERPPEPSLFKHGDKRGAQSSSEDSQKRSKTWTNRVYLKGKGGGLRDS